MADQYREKLRQAQEKAKAAGVLIRENVDEHNQIPEDVEAQVADLIAEAQQLRDEANRLKRQAALVDKADRLLSDLDTSAGRQAVPSQQATANLVVGEGTPTPTVEQIAHDVRYGEMSKQVMLLIRDLYDSVEEYKEKRLLQFHSFSKYVRYGDRVLTNSEYDSLKSEPIMTPDQLLSAVKMGVPYKDIKATLVEASDVLGGFLVPEDFRADVIRRAMGLTIVRSHARVIPTSRDVVEWPKLAGGDDRYTSSVRVTWVDATPTAGAAQTNPTFGMEKIPVHTVMAETFLGRNLIEDSAVPVTDLLQELFAEAVAIDEDEQFLVGDGVGKPQGILPGGANTLALSEVNTGSATAMTADGIRSLKRGIARQYRAQAVWMMNSATALALELLKDTTGNYYFDLDGDTLLRKPFFEDESLPDVAAGSYPVVYGDWSGYIIADRIGMTVERYLGSPEARINQVVYVLRRRLGGQCVEPWKFAVQKVAA